MKNNLKTIKLIFPLTLCIFTSACYECYSDVCWETKERARFLSLSPEQQRETLEECKKWVPISCYTYTKPTPEELKNKK